MYIEKAADSAPIKVSSSIRIILMVLLVAMRIGGVFPSPLMDLIQLASEALIS